MNLLSVARFTNLGYALHSRNFSPVDADLSGETVLITGGTGGLGRATVEALAGLGARVVAVSRSADKLDELRKEIEGDIATIQADLSLMSEVRRVADRVNEEEPRLDVLINNVGVLLPERQETEEGLEKTFAIDLAGHFLLTNALVPKLLDSAPSRIINVASGGMYSQRIRPEDLQFEEGTYTGTAAYARAKRGQVILTEMWAELLEGTSVVVHSMHPGWAKTDGVASSLPTFNLLMKPLLRSPDQGADTIVWLAAGDEAASSTGGFWFDRRQVSTHLVEATRETQEDRERLWSGLVELTGADFPHIGNKVQ